MRYEGERVNIDGTTEISTGSHGQRKTVADALPLFDSESTANFTANYVQLGPVISGGNGFTGAINGKLICGSPIIKRSIIVERKSIVKGRYCPLFVYCLHASVCENG